LVGLQRRPLHLKVRKEALLSSSSSTIEGFEEPGELSTNPKNPYPY
jgi:hypothetical protein